MSPTMNRSTPFFALLRLVTMMITIMMMPLAHAQTPYSRIVSVDGNATEILLELGLADSIVAADLTSQSLLNHPVDNLGYHRTLSAEGVLNARPDVIIGSDHMGPDATLAAIKKANIPVLTLNSPANLTQLMANIRLLAEKLQQQQAGERLVNQVSQRQQALVQQRPGTPPKMVFLLDVGERGLSQAGRDTTGDALIQLLGGENISQFSGYKSISVEALLAINPDIILVGSRSDSLDSAEQLLTRQPLLQHSKAGNNAAVVSVNAATLIAGLSLGALAEAERLADRLYR